MCEEVGATAVVCSHWAEGGKGAKDLAQAVVDACAAEPKFEPLYPVEMSIRDKITTVVQVGSEYLSFTSPFHPIMTSLLTIDCFTLSLEGLRRRQGHIL